MKRRFQIGFRLPVVLVATGFLFSCVNDIDTIQKVTNDPNAPDEVTKNLHVHYTDSGYAKVNIRAALAETYYRPEHKTFLTNGIRVDFYSEEGEIVSSLTARSGEINYASGLMVARDSVVLRNLKKKQYLETEELYYNQKDSTIYTNKHVIIKKDGKGVIGRGKGIKTTQFFYKGVVTEPEGKIDFSEE